MIDSLKETISTLAISCYAFHENETEFGFSGNYFRPYKLLEDSYCGFEPSFFGFERRKGWMGNPWLDERNQEWKGRVFRIWDAFEPKDDGSWEFSPKVEQKCTLSKKLLNTNLNPREPNLLHLIGHSWCEGLGAISNRVLRDFLPEKHDISIILDGCGTADLLGLYPLIERAQVAWVSQEAENQPMPVGYIALATAVAFHLAQKMIPNVCTVLKAWYKTMRDEYEGLENCNQRIRSVLKYAKQMPEYFNLSDNKRQSVSAIDLHKLPHLVEAHRELIDNLGKEQYHGNNQRVIREAIHASKCLLPKFNRFNLFPAGDYKAFLFGLQAGKFSRQTFALLSTNVDLLEETVLVKSGSAENLCGLNYPAVLTENLL